MRTFSTITMLTAALVSLASADPNAPSVKLENRQVRILTGARKSRIKLN